MTTQAMTFIDEEEEDRFVTADGDLLDEDQADLSEDAIVDTLRLNILDTLHIAQTDFTVLRIKRDMLGRSNLGFIAIDKQPGSEANYKPHWWRGLHPVAVASRPQFARICRQDLDSPSGGPRPGRPAGTGLPPGPL